MNEPVSDLLVLQALRLKGFAAPQQVASVYGLPPSAVEAALARLASEGAVRHRAPQGWVLSSTGRAMGERLLAEQLDRTRARREITSAYDRFRTLNPEFLQLCTDWQVVDVDQQRLNTHDDPVYDQLIVKRLVDLDERVQPICNDLAKRLGRFGRYGPGFDHALSQTQQGATEWLTGASIESYHTLWFELHEDLLATLGRTRAQEREEESNHA